MPFVALYIIMDPFRVLRSYDDYLKGWLVEINQNYVSTEVYLKNHIRYGYDSFIFGSSRTMGYRTNDWKTYLGEGASPFVFNGTLDTISRFRDKLRFIDSQGGMIKNGLFIVSLDATFSDLELNSHWVIDHPAVSSGSWIFFHYVFFKAFYTKYFYKIFEDFGDYGQKAFLNPENQAKLDPTTNDYFYSSAEQLLSEDPSAYYDRLGWLFYARDYQKKVSSQLITAQHQNDMNGIMDILRKHNTTYRVIIDPLYDQIYINPDDLSIISRVFGKQNVYDFTGENEITENIYNYYETSHYRPHVGKKLMEIIYRSSIRSDG
jgi:hypothetical protein